MFSIKQADALVQIERMAENADATNTAVLRQLSQRLATANAQVMNELAARSVAAHHDLTGVPFEKLIQEVVRRYIRDTQEGRKEEGEDLTLAEVCIDWPDGMVDTMAQLQEEIEEAYAVVQQEPEFKAQ